MPRFANGGIQCRGASHFRSQARNPLCVTFAGAVFSSAIHGNGMTGPAARDEGCHSKRASGSVPTLVSVPRRARLATMGALATAIVGVHSLAVKAQQSDSATPPAPSTTTRPAPPKDATSAFDVNFGAAITSDYNYRGYTLSDHKPSASTNTEATYNVLFAGVNTASVDMPKLSQLQMTSYAGIRPTFGKFTVEAGVTYYSYPGSAIDISYPEYYVAPTYALTSKLTVGLDAYFAPDYSRIGAWENYNAIQAKYTFDSGLSFSEVRTVLFVFGADVFPDVAVRDQIQRVLDAERPRVHLRIVHRDLHVHVAEVPPPVPFLDLQSVTVRMTGSVQPASIVETHCVYYQRIAFPPAD